VIFPSCELGPQGAVSVPHRRHREGALRAHLCPVAARTLPLVVAVILIVSAGGAFAYDLGHQCSHTIGLHGTGICAWMCGTGADIETAPTPVVSHDACQCGARLLSAAGRIQSEAVGLIHSRAPPNPLF